MNSTWQWRRGPKSAQQRFLPRDLETQLAPSTDSLAVEKCPVQLQPQSFRLNAIWSTLQ
jgi:hypothetical protein